MTDAPSILQNTLVATPEDRPVESNDPFWRRARRRFPQLLMACLAVHLTIILLLYLMDQPDNDSAPPVKEIPVQIVVQPPPPPPPKPEQKKPEVKKPEPPQKHIEVKVQPPPAKPHYEPDTSPAYTAPRAANQETIKREANDDKTRSTVVAPPSPANETKPTPNAQKEAQNAAPDAADQTTSPQETDEKDAEALNKAAPTRDKKSAQRAHKAKHRAPMPADERGAVARELASLEPSPSFTFATKAAVSPVSGGTEDMRYLSVLWGLIMPKIRPPKRILHNDVQVTVGFWVDDSGALENVEIYRTSGYPEFDQAAKDAVRRAAPFPQPPYGEPHGFVATMPFPAR